MKEIIKMDEYLMPIYEAEQWIERFEAGNYEDKYRTSSDLQIVLRLMLHSHLKIETIRNLSVGEYRSGNFVKLRSGEYMYHFEVTDEDDAIVEAHIRKYKLKDNDNLLRVSDRALRKKFKHLVKAYYTHEEGPELADIYYSGIRQPHKRMKRPKKEQ